MKHKKLTVKWKIFAYFLVFVALILIILWLFQTVFLDTFYKAIKTAQIKACAGEIAGNLEIEDFSSFITEISRRYDTKVYVVREDGTVLANTAKWEGDATLAIPEQELAGFFQTVRDAGGSLNQVQESRTFSPEQFGEEQNPNPFFPLRARGPMVNLTYTLLAGENKDTLILLGAFITPVDATVQTLRIQLLCVTAIMVAIALVLAFIISRKISRPIARLGESAQELALGRPGVRFEASGYREIMELSDTLNYASAELSKVEELRRELIANVSHDLRTPLTMISAYAEGMRDLPGENNAENAQIIIDEARRLATLVNDLLDLSKLQSGSQEIQREKFNFTESVRSIITRYAKLTNNQGFSIGFQYDRTAYVCGDELRISQVIYNIVGNAVNYTGEDKKVFVRQSCDGGEVLLEVTDTGEGIPEEELPYVFERYYRSKKTHKRAEVGTGIGLSIAKEVLLMHGARYGVRSTVGRGSTFWFALPREKKERR